MTNRTAQAVVLRGPNQLDFAEIKLKPLGEEDVLVKTCYTSVSAGTERMLVSGQMIGIPMLPLPCVPGYETVGEIVEVGSAVPDGFLGQLTYIGGCFGYEGVHSAWGGQSSYVTANYNKAYLLNGIDPVEGVAVAPAATSWHGIELMDIKPGQIVLVLGGGPIGQLAAQAARLKGAEVILADKHQDKLDKAFGDYTKIDVSTTVLKDSLPGPVDVLVDATGKMPAIADCLPLMRNQGKVCLLGFYRRLDLDFVMPFWKEISFHPSREWVPADVPAVMAAMREGTIHTASLFTHHFKIADYQAAYDAALNNSNCLKVLMEWD